ncbi:2OG-Fe(II) oxygenase [Thalassotalea euphylliae]|uniref:2OG-Fe(II) oxygenase n=1 Tax=Thalassotalea euphylliae TaxID=1655234 RepID=UPI003635E4A1
MIQFEQHNDALPSLHDTFAAHGVVRINNFLDADVAQSLANDADSVSFKNAFFLDGKNQELSDDDIRAMPADKVRNLYRNLYKLASTGVGFLYGRHKLSEGETGNFDQVIQSLNSERCLSLINAITNKQNLKSADGQVTRYRVGDYLTRHIDNIQGETREIAYVLGLSPEWHPDWGGLLQFFELNGTPTNSYMPEFNSLTIFDVNKVHSVTSIAPFSPKNRYSVTGWFRS